MKRIPLPVGAQIQSDSLCFTIDSVLGYGANCIVYNAHYDDGYKHDKKVIIKECYPVRASVSRQEHSLSWESIDEIQSAFDRMQRSYDLASEMQDSDVTRSASVYTLDKISANGTQYIIMIPQHGHSYDKDNSTDIADIIRTVLALCNAVGLYHQAGYLHLDIKPNNFIAATDHTGKGKNIALFDLDTLVALDGLQGTSLAGVSYTKEWAAPEQKQMQIAKLCPATDLYAIGAVLFKRIMNRMPSNADLSPFAIWEFDERFSAKKVNPKAKRLLTDIFHKTLAANVKRRYQTADELSSALSDVLEVVSAKAPYLISGCPVNTVKVIGRSSELRQIHYAFSSGDHDVFLYGEGGIGKSTLAIQYGTVYKDKYDAVILLRYRDSLESLLDSIFVFNCDTRDRDERLQVLKGLLDSHILLIIDNFDVAVDEDNFLQDLLSFGADILITTRTDFRDSLQDGAAFIDVNTLPNHELLTVFSNASGQKIVPEQKKALSELFANIGNNTFVVDLLGKQAATSDYSVDYLIGKVSEGLCGLEQSEKVKANKDGRIVKKPILDIIRLLFNSTKIDEKQKQALRNLYVLRFLNIDKETYLSFNWEKPMNMDVINDLVEIGWVRKNDKYYSLHPLVEEVVKMDLHPCADNCESVFYRVSARVYDCMDGYSPGVEAEEKAYYKNLKLILRFLAMLDFNIASNLQFAIKCIGQLIDNYEINSDIVIYKNDVQLIMHSLETKMNESISEETRFDIHYVLYGLFVFQYVNNIINISADCFNEETEARFQFMLKLSARIDEPAKTERIERLYKFTCGVIEDWQYWCRDFFSEKFNEHPRCKH